MRNCQAIAPSPARLEGAGGTGGPGRGAGGRRQGLVGLRADAPSHTQQHGAAGVEGAGGTGGPGRGAGGWRQGQGGPRDRPLRAVRLACGDLAGGPPPTGTHSGPAHSGRPRGGRRSGGARNTSGATRNAARTRTERIPYSPRNALIAGISRTACTRPAR